VKGKRKEEDNEKYYEGGEVEEETAEKG